MDGAAGGVRAGECNPLGASVWSRTVEGFEGENMVLLYNPLLHLAVNCVLQRWQVKQVCLLIGVHRIFVDTAGAVGSLTGSWTRRPAACSGL